MSDITPENVKLKDWISVGINDAVVCHIYEDEPGKIEVVYFDHQNKAINDDVQYKNGKWTFVNDGPSGGYAENSARLGEFVRKLKAGRSWE